MKSGKKAVGRMGALGRAPAALISILVIIGALAAALALTGASSTKTLSTSSSIQVEARAIDASGNPVTNATYRLGQELLLSVTVPSTTSPVSVHQVINGRVFGELGWNVTATKHTYVIDSGPADPADLGVNHAYAIVTFADGSSARSNNVTWTVVG